MSSSPTVDQLVATAVAATGKPPIVRPTTPSSATPSSAGRVRLLITAFNCDALQGYEPQGLGMTYCFDTTDWADPARVTVRFDGRLLDALDGAPASRSFSIADTVDVPSGAGPVTVTSRAPQLAAGRWAVTATATVETNGARTSPARVWNLPSATATGDTAFDPVMRVRAPGARLGVWPALVLTGALLAYATQLLIAPRLDVPVWPLVIVSVLASLTGLVTSKIYHKLLHPKETGGWVSTGLGIQGFVLGAIAVLLIGVAVTDLPPLRSLDTIAPGLLLGMAIGRLGCFFGGCCAGRPTSGWGLWSSDRHVGIRRIPVQLFESAVAGAVFVATIVVDLSGAAPAGTVFVGGLAAYTLGRQMLFPLRDIERQTRHGRQLMIGVTCLILVADVILGFVV